MWRYCFVLFTSVDVVDILRTQATHARLLRCFRYVSYDTVGHGLLSLMSVWYVFPLPLFCRVAPVAICLECTRLVSMPCGYRRCFAAFAGFNVSSAVPTRTIILLLVLLLRVQILPFCCYYRSTLNLHDHFPRNTCVTAIIVDRCFLYQSSCLGS